MTSKIDYITARQQMAISNFLGMEEEEINEKVNDVLQGNLPGGCDLHHSGC